MTREDSVLRPFVRTSFALLLAAPAAALPVEIVHEPVGCVPRDRYARVTASATRPEDVATVELQFRAGPRGDWYVVPMFAEGAAWSARLPRPLASFQYRVVMTSTSLEATPTPAYDVAVDAAGACSTAAEPSIASSIVVRVPRGAPLVPPVPSGFSPAGVVAAQEQVLPGTRSGGGPKWVAAVVGGAAVGGTVLAVTSGEGPPKAAEPDIPAFNFSHTAPVPGSELSLSRPDALRVFVNMDHEPEFPVDFFWLFELGRRESPRTPCAAMSGTFNDAKTPLGLVLAAPLLPSGACGTTFQTDMARLVLTVAGEPVYDVVVDMPFRVVP